MPHGRLGSPLGHSRPTAVLIDQMRVRTRRRISVQPVYAIPPRVEYIKLFSNFMSTIVMIPQIFAAGPLIEPAVRRSLFDATRSVDPHAIFRACAGVVEILLDELNFVSLSFGVSTIDLYRDLDGPQCQGIPFFVAFKLRPRTRPSDWHIESWMNRNLSL
jgi:hypothetical protein